MRERRWTIRTKCAGVELEGHPFFVATLFEPEMRPEGSPNPLVHAFASVCIRRARGATTKVAG